MEKVEKDFLELLKILLSEELEKQDYYRKYVRDAEQRILDIKEYIAHLESKEVKDE